MKNENILDITPCTLITHSYGIKFFLRYISFSNYNWIVYFMKSPNKRDLITVIDRSAQELHEKIDMHRYLMTTILEQRVGDRSIKQVFLPSYYSGEGKLKEAIQEAIEVLEESRKAFKSKRLEALRKMLTQVLIESK